MDQNLVQTDPNTEHEDGAELARFPRRAGNHRERHRERRLPVRGFTRWIPGSLRKFRLDSECESFPLWETFARETGPSDVSVACGGVQADQPVDFLPAFGPGRGWMGWPVSLLSAARKR